ncbi:MAG: 4-alpha-glucanotransferase, partial [Bacteroidota bacterium]
GWFRQEADKATKNRFRQYTGVKLKEKNCSKAFIRQTYASVAKIVIVQMQDWFDLDERSRMNFPSTTEGNWLWRAVPSLFTGKLKKRMRRMVKLFGRY